MSVWYSVKAARSGVVAVNKRGVVAVNKRGEVAVRKGGGTEG